MPWVVQIFNCGWDNVTGRNGLDTFCLCKGIGTGNTVYCRGWGGDSGKKHVNKIRNIVTEKDLWYDTGRIEIKLVWRYYNGRKM